MSAWDSGFAASNRLLLADLREPFCLCSGAYVNLVTSGIPQAELTKVGPLLLHARTCLCWYGWAPLQASPGQTSPTAANPRLHEQCQHSLQPAMVTLTLVCHAGVFSSL